MVCCLCEGTEVHRVHMEYVKNPWLLPRLCRGVDGKDDAHRSFVLFGELPYNELVIFAMAVWRSQLSS